MRVLSIDLSDGQVVNLSPGDQFSFTLKFDGGPVVPPPEFTPAGGQLFLANQRIEQMQTELKRILRDLPVQNGTLANRIKAILEI